MLRLDRVDLIPGETTFTWLVKFDFLVGIFSCFELKVWFFARVLFETPMLTLLLEDF
jgi:hypothetical protein